MATWRWNQQKTNRNSNNQNTKKQYNINPRLLIYESAPGTTATGTIRYITAVPFVMYKKEYIARIGDLIEESNGDYILKPAYLRYLEEENFRSATIITNQERYVLQTSRQYPNLFEVKQPLFVNNQIILAPLFRTITKYDNR